MEALVLLKDEVAYVKWLGNAGGMPVLLGAFNDASIADYLCKTGLTIRRDRVIQLTELGRQVARMLQEDGTSSVRVITSVELLSLQVVQMTTEWSVHRAAIP